jgi:glutamyl-tRNA synthetase
VPTPNTHQPGDIRPPPPPPTPPTPATPPAVTRLAPSPTGALHLGNARTFLVNWALARTLGWHIVLRIEDLDGPRIKPDAARGIVDTLSWLGIDWDEGPHVQSADLSPYRDALARLARAGLAYSSDLTRAQIEAAASAPQEGSTEVRFPPELRPAGFVAGRADPAALRPLPTGEPAPGFEQSWRFATPAGPVRWVDRFAGATTADPAQSVGDFTIWTKRGTPAYQLAVVVDDARQGVTEVVRGDDLLDSAARQIRLYEALNLGPPPAYTHLPLVLGPDGRRLAKRHGDTRVDTYRAAGVPAERVIGLIASWSGAAPPAHPEPMTAQSFAARLSLDRIPRQPVIFSAEADAWLRGSDA